MIERHSTAWYETLDAYVAARRDLPFAWGTQDCCTFAADWVAQATGYDPMADLRGLTTALAAHRTLAELGGLRAAVDARLGPHLAGPFAQAGDVALLTLNSGSTVLALCVGAWLAVPGEQHLELFPLDKAEATWRV